MDNQIYNILNDMSDYLNVSQMKKLQEILIKRLEGTNEAECFADEEASGNFDQETGRNE